MYSCSNISLYYLGFSDQFAASDREEEIPSPGQFADCDDREEDVVKLVGGNKENESPPAPARAPAGIGRGVALLPPSAFSVGLGRGVLRGKSEPLLKYGVV